MQGISNRIIVIPLIIPFQSDPRGIGSMFGVSQLVTHSQCIVKREPDFIYQLQKIKIKHCRRSKEKVMNENFPSQLLRFICSSHALLLIPYRVLNGHLIIFIAVILTLTIGTSVKMSFFLFNKK